MKGRKRSTCKGEDNRDKGQDVNFCLMDGRQNSSTQSFNGILHKKNNGFIVHNKFIASYGCMKRNGEEIVCISYTNLWYCVNGIISSTVKSVIPSNFFIGIFLYKTKCKTIDSILTMPSVLSSIIDTGCCEW